MIVSLLMAVSCNGAEGGRRPDPPAVPAPAPTAVPHPGKTRGMNFAHAMNRGKGYGSEASLDSLRRLQALHVNAIAVTPFGFQRQADDTDILWTGTRGDHGHGIGETDEAVRGVIAQAHSLGMRVLLKPHLWLRPPEWPGSIHQDSDVRWAAWFAAYRAFILHYAAMAESTHAEMLCIGNELTIASQREAEWRALIADVRKVYRGRLTYGANLEEVFDVPFWDALDAIGLSAYFPLSEEASPSRATIESGWRPIAKRLEELSGRTHRPILITELGYASRDFATEKPWEESGQRVNLQLQADAFAAFFSAVWTQPWLEGAFLWKWESYPDHADANEMEFAFEHKPAERVIGDAYAAADPAPQPAPRGRH